MNDLQRMKRQRGALEIVRLQRARSVRRGSNDLARKGSLFRAPRGSGYRFPATPRGPLSRLRAYPVEGSSFLLALAVLFPASLARADTPRHVQVEHVMDLQGDFNQPTEVAVGRQGSVFVLDGTNDRVKVFDKTGRMARVWGGTGDGAGEFRQPVGMYVDERENVYVADTGNQRIQIFDRNGKHERTIDMASLDTRPVEVVVSEGGRRIYVCDAKGHRILCFREDGSLLFARGEYGKQLGQFMFPGAAALDESGNLYVIDILNGRLQIFNREGREPRQIGEWGIQPGQLFRPKGVALAGHSLVYVSDSYTGVVQVWDRQGNYQGILADTQDRLLRLTTPVGLALDAAGRLYVVQMELNTVSVFQPPHQE